MLYGWQEPEARHLVSTLRRRNVALEASDTGTGKTFIAARVCKDLGARPLVVAPKSVLTPWRETLSLFGVEPLDVLNIEKLKTGRLEWLEKRNRGKTMADWRWHLPRNSMIVWDEIHNAGGRDSQNGRLLALLKAYSVPVLGLSATLADSPLRLRAFGYLCGFHDYRGFDAWCRGMGCYASPFARGKMEFPKGRARMRHLAKLHGMLFPEYGGRLRIADLPDFPECLLQADGYDLDTHAAIQEAYHEYEDALHDTDPAMTPLVLMNRLRENVELLKVPLFEELALELLAEGRSVAMFYSYRAPAEALLDRLERATGTRPGFIYGGQADRDETVARFQADENPLLVAMIQAGGQSISLHDLHGNRPRVSLINPPFSVVQLRQALGRIWRAGAKSKAVQKIVFAAGTVEDKACAAIRRKLENLDLVNDGDLNAGLEFQPPSEKG